MIKLLILHFVADFILQSRKMGENKSHSWGYLGGHVLIQFLVFLPFTSFIFAFLNAMIHGTIDKFIWNGYKLSVLFRFGEVDKNSFQFWKDGFFYTTIGFDQMLHTITLAYLGGFF